MVNGREDVTMGGELVLSCVTGAFDRHERLMSEDDTLDDHVASLRDQVDA